MVAPFCRWLQNLMRLYASFTETMLRDLALELCLIVPATLERRVAHLHLLLQPVLLSLQPRQDRSNELISLGWVCVELYGAAPTSWARLFPWASAPFYSGRQCAPSLVSWFVSCPSPG